MNIVSPAVGGWCASTRAARHTALCSIRKPITATRTSSEFLHRRSSDAEISGAADQTCRESASGMMERKQSKEDVTTLPGLQVIYQTSRTAALFG